ncbi:hypothetical protein V1226_09220 [Lachnospiraceae bacterium JLR.KK009]|jgi:hypothetical protein
MGGQAGIRGYVYQGIVAIIKALGKNGWNKISVEYNSPLDKVDIALLDDDVIIEAIQVKSSINLFSRENIIKWIEDLLADVPASQYELILLGTPDENANIFINSVGQYYKGENTQKMKNSLNGYEAILDTNKIMIRSLPFDQDILLAQVRDMLNEYIDKKGFAVKQSVLARLAEMILGADMLLATAGQSISREHYDKRIFDWLNLSCGQQLKNDNQFSSIEAVFYSKGKFLNKIKPLGIIDLQGYIQLKQNNDRKAKTVIDEMIQIDVNAQDQPIIINGEEYINVKDPMLQSKTEAQEYVVDSKLKENIITYVNELFGICLDESFFDFGSLKKKKGLNGIDVLVGTDKQKRKERLMWDLIKRISEALEYENYISAFQDIKILPVVLRNNGRINDKKIMLTLKIPAKSVSFLDLNMVVNTLCSQFEMAKELNDDNITELIWTPTEDENIGWEGNGGFYSMIDTKRYFNSQSLAIEKEKMLEELKHQIEYEKIYDANDNVIIKWEMDGLRPEEALMLSKYLVFKDIKENTVIDYSIMSQEASGKIEGKLFVD